MVPAIQHAVFSWPGLTQVDISATLRGVEQGNEMPHGFWEAAPFWVGLYLAGYVGGMAAHLVPAIKDRLQRVPDCLRTLLLIPFLSPPAVLPLVPQPRLPWPRAAGWLIGAPLLALATAMGVLAATELGLRPAWGKAKGLVTTGVYGVVRHPVYLSIILFATGWAIGFRAIYALLFVPALAASYAVMILVEEQGLRTEYGDAYREYTERVPWRLIPGVF